MSKIHFETIKDFKNHCKTANIKPLIQYNAKKHQNRKNEFLHEISGIFVLNDKSVNFTIDEMTAFIDKKYPIDKGYKLSTLK